MNLQQRLFAFFSVAVVLLAASVDASAVTIGRVRGNVLLGSPLNLTVQLQFAPDEDASSNCYSANVWYGEFAQPAGQIKVTPEQGKQAGEVQLRVTSATRLDEPTVKVTLGVGCSQKVSRTFQMLAEVLTDVQEPVSVKGANLASVASPDKTEVPAAPGSAPSDPVPNKVPKNTSQTTAAKPRLKVDGGVSVSGVAPGKNASKDKRVEIQIEEVEKRLDSLVRQKLEASQAGLEANEAKLKALDADLKSLQALAVKNQSNVDLLAQTLEKTSSSNSLSGLIYVLTGALVLCLAGFGYFVWTIRNQRSGREGPWWRASSETDRTTDLMQSQGLSPVSVPEKVAPNVASFAESSSIPKVNGVAAEGASKETAETDLEDIDLAIDLAALESQALSTASAPSTAPSDAVTEPERSERRDFANSSASALRALNTKDMMDIRQQAEFFMALGQHDDAIGLLLNSINKSNEANPLVYLDLLKLLHTLGRKQEFDSYVKEFNVQFTGRAPEFEQFNLEGNGLDAYADICSQIVELWPGSDAIDYIEQCLVRTPEDEPDSGFDLEAFRDLLMLHGILKRLDAFADSSMVPFSTSRTTNTQLGELKESGDVGSLDTVPLPDVSADHEHLDFSEFLPGVSTPEGNAGNQASAEVAPTSPAISPAAYSDLDLGGKPGNLIDFDLSGLDSLGSKKDKA